MAGGALRAWLVSLILAGNLFSISIEEAVESALKNNLQLGVKRLEVDIKESERRESFGNLLPQINLEASYNIAREQSFTFSLPTPPGPVPAPEPQEFVFLKETFTKFTLQAYQRIFDLSSIRQYGISRLAEKVQELIYEEEKNRLRYQVREAYIKALKAKAVLDMLKKQLSMAESHLRDVEAMYEEGLVPLIDVLRTRVRVHEIKEKIVNAEGGLSKALEYLSYLTGTEVRDVEEVDGQEDVPDEETLLSRMRERPLLRFMRMNLELARKGRELAGSYFYPQAVLSAFYQRTEESDLFPKDRFMITFALRWNLFSGMRRFAGLEKARLLERKAGRELLDLERKLRLELRNTLEDVRTALKRIELARAQLETAREQLRVVENRFREGLATSTEVLSAQSFLVSAERALKMSKYDLILLNYKLREVAGYE